MNGKKFQHLWLHVGPPKTGTTALQRSIFEHRDALLGIGIYSPSFERNHRFFAKHFSSRSQLLSEYPTFTLKQYESELASAGCDKALLTSEHFVRLTESELVNMADYVTSQFESVDVVYFVRDPLLALPSMVQEVIKNGGKTRAELVERPFGPRNKSILSKLVAAFGRDRITLLRHDRLSDGNADAPAAFYELIGFEDFDRKSVTFNQSMGKLAFRFANELTSALIESGEARGGMDWLRYIQGPRYHIDPELLAANERYTEIDRDYLKSEWGVTFQATTLDVEEWQPTIEATEDELNSIIAAAEHLLASEAQLRNILTLFPKIEIAAAASYTCELSREEQRAIALALNRLSLNRERGFNATT